MWAEPEPAGNGTGSPASASPRVSAVVTRDERAKVALYELRLGGFRIEAGSGQAVCHDVGGASAIGCIPKQNSRTRSRQRHIALHRGRWEAHRPGRFSYRAGPSDGGWIYSGPGAASGGGTAVSLAARSHIGRRQPGACHPPRVRKIRRGVDPPATTVEMTAVGHRWMRPGPRRTQRHSSFCREPFGASVI
jgi:hypothetical protein